jgi:hypothetical protein
MMLFSSCALIAEVALFFAVSPCTCQRAITTLLVFCGRFLFFFLYNLCLFFSKVALSFSPTIGL